MTDEIKPPGQPGFSRLIDLASAFIVAPGARALDSTSDPGGNFIGASMIDRPERLVGNDPTSGGQRIGIVDIDPAFHEFLSTGLMNGMFGDSDSETDTSLYWTKVDSSVVAWDVIVDPAAPGGFKWRYTVPPSGGSLGEEALLRSAAVPAIDLFGYGVAVYYSLAGPGSLSSITLNARVYWTDEDGLVIADEIISLSDFLPRGERASVVLGSVAPSVNAARVAVELRVSHVSVAPDLALDIYGVVLRPLIPAGVVLEPKAPFVLEDLGDHPINDLGLQVASGASAAQTHYLYALASRLWASFGPKLGPLTFAGCRVYRTTDFNVADDNDWHELPFGSDHYDTDSFHDDSTSGHSHFVFVYAGWYRLRANVAFENDGTGERRARIIDEAGYTWGIVSARGTSAGKTMLQVDSDWVYLDTPGQFLKVEVRQTSGSGLLVTAFEDEVHAMLEYRA